MMGEKAQTVFRFVYSEAILHAFRRLAKYPPLSPVIKDPNHRNLDAEILRLPELFQELVADGVDPLKVHLLRAEREDHGGGEAELKLPPVGKSRAESRVGSRVGSRMGSRMGKSTESSKQLKLPVVK
jgi:hypothetical protein